MFLFTNILKRKLHYKIWNTVFPVSKFSPPVPMPRTLPRTASPTLLKFWDCTTPLSWFSLKTYSHFSLRNLSQPRQCRELLPQSGKPKLWFEPCIIFLNFDFSTIFLLANLILLKRLQVKDYAKVKFRLRSIILFWFGGRNKPYFFSEGYVEQIAFRH